MALGCLVYTISSRSRMRVPSDPDVAAALRIARGPSLTQVSERFRPKKRERPRQLAPPGPSEALEMLQPILDRELAICTDGRTFEFSALTGRYLRPLEYMSASWLLANIDAIFPASKENFFAAATGALYGNVDPALYSFLS